MLSKSVLKQRIKATLGNVSALPPETTQEEGLEIIAEKLSNDIGDWVLGADVVVPAGSIKIVVPTIGVCTNADPVTGKLQ